MDRSTNSLEAISAWKGIAVAALYGVCSMSMTFVNKGLMTSFKFDYPVFIMVMQMLLTVCVLEILRMFKFANIPRYTLQRGKSFAYPALFYGLNSLFGLSALSDMNVAMYGVLKRCVPLTTIFLSVVILKKGIPTKTTVISVLMMTCGCVIASFGDLKFNMNAYIYGVLSNLTQTAYLLLIQKYTQKLLTVAETMQLNSFNILPFLTLYIFLGGEIYDVMAYNQPRNPAFILIFTLTISMGCLLNYSLFLCTSLTSALTTSVVGGMKAVLQTVLGMFTFGGISHNMTTYVGITTNVSGSVMYLYAKYRESKQRAQESGGNIHKVISVSTAEDFKEYAKSGSGNGHARWNQNSVALHPIEEKVQDQGLLSVSVQPFNTESTKSEE